MEKHRYALNWEGIHSLAEVCHLPSLIQAAELLELALETPDKGRCGGSTDISVMPAGSTYLLSAGTTRLPISDPLHFTQFLAVTIPWTFFNLSPYPVLHASSCVVNDEAVLFCGGSETGKSSLAAIAWERGFPVINDDCTAIEPLQAKVRPFPQGLSLRLQEPEIPEPFACALGDRVPYCLGKGWKSDHWVVFGRSLRGVVPYGFSYPVKALYFVRRAEKTRIVPAARETALTYGLISTFRTQNGRLGILPFIEALWRQNKIYELEVGERDINGAFTLAISPFV